MSSKYDYWSALGRQQQATASHFRILPGSSWRGGRWSGRQSEQVVSNGQRSTHTAQYTPGVVDSSRYPYSSRAQFAYPPKAGEPIQCRGPRSCGAWCCSSDIHCPRCGKYLVQPTKGQDPAFHTGPQSAGSAAQAGGDKNGVGGKNGRQATGGRNGNGGNSDSPSGKGGGKGAVGQPPRQFHPPMDYDIVAAKALQQNLRGFGVKEDNELLAQITGEIVAAEARAAKMAIKGPLSGEAKRLGFALDKKWRQLDSWQAKFDLKKQTLANLQAEVGALAEEGEGIKQGIMDIEANLSKLGTGNSHRPSSDMECSFVDSLPPAVREKCKQQVEELQQLMDQLQSAAAEEAKQQPEPEGPAIVEVPDFEDDGSGIGAAPSHSDGARVGPYKGAERPLDAAPAVANGLDDLAELLRLGTITEEGLQQLQDSATALQSSLAVVRANRGAATETAAAEAQPLSCSGAGGLWVQDSQLG